MVGNIKQIRKLLMNEWTLVGTVTSVDTTEGTSIITTEGGNTIKVRGTSVQSGDKALVVNGVIVSRVPNVSFYEFEV